MTEEDPKEKFDYGSLAEKYRPLHWSGLVGVNPQYIENLKYFIKKDLPLPSILIIGPSGSGKTTLARIIGRTINCLNRKPGTADPCGRCRVCLGLSTANNTEITIERASDKERVEELISRSNSAPYIIRGDNGEEVVNDEQRVVYILNEIQNLSYVTLQSLLNVLERQPHETKRCVWILTTMNLSLGNQVPQAIDRRSLTYQLGYHSKEEIKRRLSNIFPQMRPEAIEAFSSLNNKTIGHAWSNFNLIYPRVDIEDITEEIIYETLGGGCTPKRRIELYKSLYTKNSNTLDIIESWRSKGLSDEDLTNFILKDLAIYSLYINSDEEANNLIQISRDICNCFTESIPIEYALLPNSHNDVFGVLGKCKETDKYSNSIKSNNESIEGQESSNKEHQEEIKEDMLGTINYLLGKEG